ncbi:NtaA/DmoA family FMN-dependent monooxygenase [Phytohabitans suffuscus]|uniref:Nitrilotriacetate monooxygenase n=1 Tax=Phytohabitans suffuscus TaxID=624315 RepID=A0A6F8YF99_9ACTN|nr:NtaA/DmoA family FMN-dependent monooxygenase [Phytohabitans suffuscus]BCB84772.1 nitrilotriacetate monooxygenase [Phytohabitans suffuscus]
MTTQRQILLNMNLIGAGAHTGAWRWPGNAPSAFASIDSYVTAARHSERGRLDAVFLADTPALRDGIDRHPQLQGFDPAVIATAVTAATERIGAIVTASTTLGEPYDLARRIRSVDVASGGRAGWNVVVTGTPAAAANFGHLPFPGKSERYARAEEFVDVVLALWRSWHPRAVLADTAAGAYADPTLIRAIAHRGTHFQVAGPLTLPPSPQGYPVLVQAGASPAGRALAARTADVIFSSATTIEHGREFAADVRALAVHHRRDPHTVAVLPGLITVLGSTEREARQRMDELHELSDPADALRRLAFGLHVDVADLRLDEPVPAGAYRGDLAGLAASEGNYQALIALAHQGLTVREILRRAGTGGHRVFVGTGEQLAQDIIRWHAAGAADGFNLMPDVLSDGVPALVDEMLPHLRAAGLFRSEYSTTTLRGHYRLPEPQFT